MKRPKPRLDIHARDKWVKARKLEVLADWSLIVWNLYFSMEEKVDRCIVVYGGQFKA